VTRGIRKPDFFIVGAPKCGTTALHVYLRQHPDVFMPAEKEHNHFATDLVPATDPYHDRDHYLKLFAAARTEKRVGETSVFHLFSLDAAKNIHAFNTEAKIIVMLRDPVSWLASYYSQMVYNGDEDIADLEGALAAETPRRRGEGIPANLRFPERLFYRDVGRFALQVARYFDRFGRDAVHVILQDDFAKDPRTIFRQTLEFLGVDPGFEPEFANVNPNKAVRSPWLNDFLRRPPAWAAAPVTALLPRAIRRSMRARVRRANAVVQERAPLDPALRLRLAEELRPDLDRLATLLDRDLSHWCSTS